MKILIIGKGFIGRKCAQMWPEAEVADTKIFSREDAFNLLDKYTPDVILNAAGVRGKPNVDWCETHQIETIEGNTIMPLFLAEACTTKNIYLLHVGSGCIFYGPSPDPKGWKEDDFGNPKAVYSRAKWATDLCLSTLPNVAIARIRMPIDYVPSAENLITKLASFSKVIDVENSVTVVEDMVNAFYQLLNLQASGIFHVTNPGTIKHKEILALYEKYVDPSHKNEWITDKDLVNLGLAKKERSNNFLQSDNLSKLKIKMRPIKEAMEDTMVRYAKLYKPAIEKSY